MISQSVIRCPDLMGHSNCQPHRVIALGYYDGPTSGILQCGVCLAEYMFDMIDWNQTEDGEDTRIFVLCPLPKGSFGEIVKFFPKGKCPSMPVWVTWLQLCSDPKGAERCIKETSDRASPPEVVMAWIGYWGRKIIAVKNLATKDLPNIEDKTKRFGRGCDWFAFLGLVR